MCAILWVICALGAASTVSSNSLRTADGAAASDVVANGASTFLIMADWGGQDAAPFYTPAEKKVAASMGSMGANASFALAIGDNFYYSGVADVGSARFKATFEATQPGVSFSGIPNETLFFRTSSTTRASRRRSSSRSSPATTTTSATSPRSWPTRRRTRRAGTSRRSTTPSSRRRPTGRRWKW